MTYPRLRLLTALLLFIAPTLSPTSALALGDEVVISTGREGGSYYYIGDRLKSALTLTDSTPRPRVLLVTSRGSLENLTRLDDPTSEVNVGLAQEDALETYIASHPEFVDEFLVLAKTGPECALLIAAKGGPLSTAADLKLDRGLTLSIDDDNSGAAITYARLSKIAPAFANTRAVPVDAMEALLELRGENPYSKLAGALLIQRPTRASAPIKVMLDNPDAYSLVPITQQDIAATGATPDSHSYTFSEVEVGGSYAKEKPKVKTLCTQGLLLAAKSKLAKDMRGRLSAIMLERGDRIIGASK